jgi:septum formation protein
LIRLGSNSATRALILKSFGIEFIQNGGDFDEDSIKTTNPKSFCYEATKGKFLELYEKYGVEDMPLLVADSVVTCEGKLLRKAKD